MFVALCLSLAPRVELTGFVRFAFAGIFTACGQMCVGAERLYVGAKVYDRFIAAVLEKMKQMKQGDPLRQQVDCGASTMPRQVLNPDCVVYWFIGCSFPSLPAAAAVLQSVRRC